jgi:hypothetical protein
MIEFPESSLVTCTTCGDFDLCIPCHVNVQHDHNLKHAFAPAAEDMTLDPLAKPLLQPDHNISHHAICDKATETNLIASTNAASQGQTVANLNPSEPGKVEENKPAEVALGQEVGFTGPTDNNSGHQLWCDVVIDATTLVVKKKEMEELQESKEEPKEGPDVVVEGPQKSQMIFPQSEKGSPATSIHQDTAPGKEQHQADDFEDFDDDQTEIDFLNNEGYDILTDVDYGILEISDEQEKLVVLRKDEDVDELANELEKKVNI